MICNTENGRCVGSLIADESGECSADADCVSDSLLVICDVEGDKTCVQCLSSSDCADGRACMDKRQQLISRC